MSSSSICSRHALLSTLTVGLLCVHTLVPNVSAKIVDSLQQGFLFDWSGDQATPIPTAAQCEVLHITWSRRSATGPNPVAPYYLQIYTSSFIVPFVIPAGSGQSFDWPVPFIPGTLFQMCMFADNGVTGGCQQIYTVYQPPNTTLDNPPVCRNLTYPAGALDVTAKTDGGSWSQYGWVDQCTDIHLTPNNGTPPYTYTVAPALRPPFNFTSDTKNSVDWTVSLAFGLPFWVSVVDSTGSTWTNGPLHASGGGLVSCLSEDSSGGKGISTGGIVGVAIGSLIAGLVAGLLGTFVFFRRREQRYAPVGGVALRRKSMEPLDSGTLGPHPPSSSSSTFPRQYGSPNDIEPFILPQDDFSPTSAVYSHSAQTSTSSRPTPSSPLHTPAQSPSPGQAGASSPTSTMNSLRSPMAGPVHGSSQAQVYVVHHDAGRPPPVTVFTSDGTEVVELPPQYESAARAGGPSQPAPQGGQRRQPMSLPAKQRRMPSNADAR